MTSHSSAVSVVLVVEDEPEICALIVEALEARGIEAVCAMNDQEAFAQIAKYAASLRLLVTDIDLGVGVTGFDLARHARKRVARLPVMYVTAHTQADFRAHGVSGAVVAPKPFIPYELADRIKAILEAQSAAGQPG